MTVDDEQEKALATVRRLIWIYCILWLVEGALRKWVVPSLSMQLLLVRDPVALAIYFYASKARVFPVNGWLSFLWMLTALIGIQALMHAAMGSVTWAVAAFGVRTFCLHLPLIWVIPAAFRRRDIVLLGKCALFLALPLALLMVVQFRVGPDHWLNAATIKGGAQIGSVFGRIRPPAIFSFITGPIHYYALCMALSIAGFLAKGLYPRWLAVAGLAASMIAMSVAASRQLVLGCAVVAMFGIIAAFRSGRALGAGVAVGIMLVAGGVGLTRFDTLREGMSAFAERWSSEDDTHAGHTVMTKRFGGSFMSAFDWAGRAPLLGIGVGSSSNLAAEKKNFDIGVEGEWERVIYEVGPLTGFLFLGLRAALSIHIVLLGFQALRNGNFVCLLLGSACFIDILNGNIRQPTTYGFIGICGGLCLAAAKAFSGEAVSEEDPEAEPEEAVPVPESAGPPRLRGRARFAVGGERVES